MEKFNDEITAKEAIATSPEITVGIEQLSAPTEIETVISEEQPLNSEPTAHNKRDARLLMKGLKTLSNNGLDDDQLSVIEEVGAEGFGILTALNAPKALKIAVTIGLAAIPLIPIILQTKNALKETKEEFSIDGLS